MTEGNRAWLSDLIVSLFLAAVVGLIVWALGGPSWAIGGFAYTVFILTPLRSQERLRRAELHRGHH